MCAVFLRCKYAGGIDLLICFILVQIRLLLVVFDGLALHPTEGGAEMAPGGVHWGEEGEGEQVTTWLCPAELETDIEIGTDGQAEGRAETGGVA